jgi:hypothetical protein
MTEKVISSMFTLTLHKLLWQKCLKTPANRQDFIMIHVTALLTFDALL